MRLGYDLASRELLVNKATGERVRRVDESSVETGSGLETSRAVRIRDHGCQAGAIKDAIDRETAR